MDSYELMNNDMIVDNRELEMVDTVDVQLLMRRFESIKDSKTSL